MVRYCFLIVAIVAGMGAGKSDVRRVEEDPFGEAAPQSTPANATEQVASIVVQPVQKPVPAEERIRAALRDATVMEFVETPLSDVVDYLKDYHKIEIQLDTKALEDVGAGSDTGITKNLKGISLRSALRLMLAGLDLTYLIKNEVLLITTPEKAAAEMEIKLYNVRDLVGDSGDAATVSKLQALGGVIQGTVQPASWSKEGGLGRMEVLALGEVSALTVAQQADVHEAIDEVLSSIRKLKAERK